MDASRLEFAECLKGSWKGLDVLSFDGVGVCYFETDARVVDPQSIERALDNIAPCFGKIESTEPVSIGVVPEPVPAGVDGVVQVFLCGAVESRCECCANASPGGIRALREIQDGVVQVEQDGFGEMGHGWMPLVFDRKVAFSAFHW